MKKKILHAVVFTTLPAGVRNQMLAEEQAARELGLPWEVVSWSADLPTTTFMKQFPEQVKSLASRRLFFMRWLKEQRESYDLILLRNPVGDPFACWMMGGLKPFVTVHHAKELEEIPHLRSGWQGKLAVLIERFAGKMLMGQAQALVAVTEEIRDYELQRVNRKRLSWVYPNGIDANTVGLADDSRGGEPKLLFVASKFQEWHGLDRVLDAMEEDLSPCHLHIAGQVSPSDYERIASNRGLADRITMHGMVDEHALNALMALCDLGLSSFSLDKQNMAEACTLKVREYLAGGLAVYSGHRDSGLPGQFPHYRVGRADLGEILKFAMEARNIPRKMVREDSLPFISKVNLLEKFYGWLTEEAI